MFDLPGTSLTANQWPCKWDGSPDFEKLSRADFDRYTNQKIIAESRQHNRAFDTRTFRAQSEAPRGRALARPLSEILRQNVEDRGYTTDAQSGRLTTSESSRAWTDRLENTGYATDSKLSRSRPHAELGELLQSRKRSASHLVDLTASSDDIESDESANLSPPRKIRSRQRDTPTKRRTSLIGAAHESPKQSHNNIVQAPRVQQALLKRSQSLAPEPPRDQHQHIAQPFERSRSASVAPHRLRSDQTTPPPRKYAAEQSYPTSAAGAPHRSLHKGSSSTCPTLAPSLHNHNPMPPSVPPLLLASFANAPSKHSRRKNIANSRNAAFGSVKSSSDRSGVRRGRSTASPSLELQKVETHSGENSSSASDTLAPLHHYDHNDQYSAQPSEARTSSPTALEHEQRLPAGYGSTKPSVASYRSFTDSFTTAESSGRSSRLNSDVESPNMVQETQAEMRERLKKRREEAARMVVDEGMSYEDAMTLLKEREQRVRVARHGPSANNHEAERQRRKEERRLRDQREEEEAKEAEERKKAKIRERQAEQQKFFERRAQKEKQERKDAELAKQKRRENEQRKQEAFARASEARRTPLPKALSTVDQYVDFDTSSYPLHSHGQSIHQFGTTPNGTTPQHASPPPMHVLNSTEPINISSDEASSDSDSDDTAAEDDEMSDGSQRKSDDSDNGRTLPKGILKRAREGSYHPTPTSKKVRIETPEPRSAALVQKPPTTKSTAQVAATQPSPTERPRLGGTLAISSSGSQPLTPSRSASVTGLSIAKSVVESAFDQNGERRTTLNGDTSRKRPSTPAMRIPSTLSDRRGVTSDVEEHSSHDEGELAKAVRFARNEKKARAAWEKKAAEMKLRGEEPPPFVYKPRPRPRKTGKEAGKDPESSSSKEKSKKEGSKKEPKRTKNKVMEGFRQDVRNAALNRGSLFAPSQSSGSPDPSDNERNDRNSAMPSSENHDVDLGIHEEGTVRTNSNVDSSHVERAPQTSELDLFVQQDEPDSPSTIKSEPDPPESPFRTADDVMVVDDTDDFVDLNDFPQFQLTSEEQPSTPSSDYHVSNPEIVAQRQNNDLDHAHADPAAAPPDHALDVFDELFDDNQASNSFNEDDRTTDQSNSARITASPDINLGLSSKNGEVAPEYHNGLVHKSGSSSKSIPAAPSTSIHPPNASSNPPVSNTATTPSTPSTPATDSRNEEGFLGRMSGFKRPSVARRRPRAPDVIDFDNAVEEEIIQPAIVTQEPKPPSRIPQAAQTLQYAHTPKTQDRKMIPSSPHSEQQAPGRTTTSNEVASEVDVLQQRLADARSHFSKSTPAGAEETAPTTPSNHPPSINRKDSVIAKPPKRRGNTSLPDIKRFKKIPLTHWAWVEAKNYLESGRAEPQDLKFFLEHHEALEALLVLKNQQQAYREEFRSDEASKAPKQTKQPPAKEKKLQGKATSVADSHAETTKSRPAPKKVEKGKQAQQKDLQSSTATSTVRSPPPEDAWPPPTNSSQSSGTSSSAMEEDEDNSAVDSLFDEPEERPMYGGKKLTRAAEEALLQGIEEDQQDEVDAEEAEILPGECFFTYRVMRKQWKTDEYESAAEWHGLGEVFTSKFEANQAADDEATVMRGGMDPSREAAWKHDFARNIHGCAEYSITVPEGFIRIQVHRTREVTGPGKLLPRRQKHWLPKKVWTIKYKVWARYRRDPLPVAMDVENDEESGSLFGDLRLNTPIGDEELEVGRDNVGDASRKDKVVDEKSEAVEGDSEIVDDDDDQYALQLTKRHKFEEVWPEVGHANQVAGEEILEIVYGMKMDTGNEKAEKRREIEGMCRDLVNLGEPIDLSCVFEGGRGKVRVWVSEVKVNGARNA